MTCIAKKHGYEVWTQFDPSAGVYELFTGEDGTDYIGCSDDLFEARQFAVGWIADRHAESF